MTFKRSHVIRNILIAVNIVLIVAYLLTCLIPFVHPGKFWFISFLGLVFPILAFALLAFIIFWFIYKSKWAWFSLLVLAIGYKQITAVFAFHLHGEFIRTKPQKTIRILQYNVMGEESIRNLKKNKIRPSVAKTLSFIKQSNADVLTFQEFLTTLDNKNSVISAIDSIGYHYHYIAAHKGKNRKTYGGVIILSKFPMENAATISFGSYPGSESLIYTDINVDGKIFRIFTTHLQSIGIDRAQYKSIDSGVYGKSTELINVDKTVAGKLKRAYQLRYDQALILKEQIDQSPYPVIVSGDFNDVPNSYTYFTIKGKLQDAFLKKGSFIGRTFRYISPTLRIDYIFADPMLKVTQFTIPSISFSDHFPVITDLQYP